MIMELIVGIITLLVAIATLCVSYISYRYAKQSDQKRIKNELARKEALLNRMKKHDFWMGMNQSVANTIYPQKKLLEAEIEELKRQLR